MLEYAAAGGVRVLKWLQQNSDRPWTAAEMTMMLFEAGLYQLWSAMWLRRKGAEWPSIFYSYDEGRKSMVSWRPVIVRWALGAGCTWGDWQCQKLAPKLYTQDEFKKDAAALFAWAHKNGCPCTCNSSSSSESN
jgi:hypothetical protein